jgi:hypothetical protein
LRSNGCEVNLYADATCGISCSYEDCTLKASTKTYGATPNKFAAEKVTDFTSCTTGSCATSATDYNDVCYTANSGGVDYYYVRQWQIPAANPAGVEEATLATCGAFGTINYCQNGACKSCSAGQTWDGSQCVAAVCTPNQYFCEKASSTGTIEYRKCDSFGTGYSVVKTCPDTYGACGDVTCPLTAEHATDQSATVCGLSAVTDLTACTSGICCSGNCDTTLENSGFDTSCRQLSCAGTDASYAAANSGNTCGTSSNYCTTGGQVRPTNTHDTVQASCTLGSCPDTQVFTQNFTCSSGACADDDGLAATVDNDALVADCGLYKTSSTNYESGSCNPATLQCDCRTPDYESDNPPLSGNCIQAYPTSAKSGSPLSSYPNPPTAKDADNCPSSASIATKDCVSQAAGYDCDVPYSKIKQDNSVIGGCT